MSKKPRSRKGKKNRKRKRNREQPKVITPSKSPPSSKERPKSSPSSKESKAWKYFSRVAVVVGLLGTVLSLIFSFLPNVVVSPSKPLDPQFALHSTPFIVSNDGPLDLHTVRYSCDILKATFRNRTKIERTKASSDVLVRSTFRPKQRDNIPCIPPRNIGAGGGFSNLLNAEIEIVISFRPAFLLATRRALSIPAVRIDVRPAALASSTQ